MTSRRQYYCTICNISTEIAEPVSACCTQAPRAYGPLVFLTPLTVFLTPSCFLNP